jgi:16S rRNA (guanine527-N7)-methyltransferase
MARPARSAPKSFLDRLTRRVRRAGATVDPLVAASLDQYLQLLALWNAKINLTAFALQDPTDEAMDRLVVEPILAARHLPNGPVRLIDIGSGSGSPALPIALASRNVSLTMVESKTRKAVFLSEAVRHLQLTARVETARFEQLLSKPEMHEAFDVLSIRAVRVEVRTLLTLQAFVRPGGLVFWFRGPSGSDVPVEPIFPLVWTSTTPLVESLRSRLIILTKAPGRR